MEKTGRGWYLQSHPAAAHCETRHAPDKDPVTDSVTYSTLDNLFWSIGLMMTPLSSKHALARETTDGRHLCACD